MEATCTTCGRSRHCRCTWAFTSSTYPMRRLFLAAPIRSWSWLRSGLTFISESREHVFNKLFIKISILREILEHKNATFHENGTLSFIPYRYSIPVPERSVGDPHKDIIICPNLPLLGISSAAVKISTFAALAISTLAKSTSASPILNITVQDYLWGYQDSLVSLAHTVMPNYIDFKRFGLMDRVSWWFTAACERKCNL